MKSSLKTNELQVLCTPAKCPLRRGRSLASRCDVASRCKRKSSSCAQPLSSRMHASQHGRLLQLITYQGKWKKLSVSLDSPAVGFCPSQSVRPVRYSRTRQPVKFQIRLGITLFHPKSNTLFNLIMSLCQNTVMVRLKSHTKPFLGIP
ncbi:hypothetical protein BaRGS_00008432 [Batillaria attramentaria]|uniref:Uncharacterized protein n=1 Tax=Batillaria attramentaria TaxID=370345 RepID=A0ABD0LL05_9CAEN